MPLYIVATPIGNLEDMTHRAIRTLKEVDLIAAEDTRHSRTLLTHYEIKTPTTSFHSHTSDAKIRALTEQLQDGKEIALISDAGTPGISDPAWPLIQSALAADIPVIPIPGPAAFLTALMGSGLPMDKFLYLGFVPAKKGRNKLFESLRDETRTAILYESPHRLLKTLTQMREVLGEEHALARQLVIARELTKLHETFHRGTISSLLTHFQTNPPKGELVLLLGPA